MAEKKKHLSAARRLARQRLAAEQAAQAARHHSNEEDLTDFLVLDQGIADADRDRDAAMGLATAKRHDAVADLRRRQGLCLQRMHSRGEPLAAIAARTGLTLADLRTLIGKTHEHVATTRNSRRATGSVSPGEQLDRRA